MLRLVGKVLLALVVLAVVAAAGLGGYRAFRQNEGERALAIAGSNGIDEGMFVDVGASSSGSRSAARTAVTPCC